jgi:uncharacterized cysteine cluster protein YcgN (CxxCxxCC family)
MAKPTRTCDGCSECCQGWLIGEIPGHQFFPGQPCFYVQESKCTNYADRPQNPCRSFNCTWIDEEVLPMWMRPDLSGVICHLRKVNDVKFYELTETGKPMEAHILNWFMIWAMTNRKNLLYRIKGHQNKLGSQEFLALDVY